nr:MAG TPA: hypothetical protein [Caudoviricetes sp.]
MYGRAAEKYRAENARRNRSARYDQKNILRQPAKHIPAPEEKRKRS